MFGPLTLCLHLIPCCYLCRLLSVFILVFVYVCMFFTTKTGFVKTNTSSANHPASTLKKIRVRIKKKHIGIKEQIKYTTNIIHIHTYVYKTHCKKCYKIKLDICCFSFFFLSLSAFNKPMCNNLFPLKQDSY